MDKECEEWIVANLPQYYTLFKEHRFKNLRSLTILDKETLIEMGVSTVGERNDILSMIRGLKKHKDTTGTASSRVLQKS